MCFYFCQIFVYLCSSIKQKIYFSSFTSYTAVWCLEILFYSSTLFLISYNTVDNIPWTLCNCCIYCPLDSWPQRKLQIYKILNNLGASYSLPKVYIRCTFLRIKACDWLHKYSFMLTLALFDFIAFDNLTTIIQRESLILRRVECWNLSRLTELNYAEDLGLMTKFKLASEILMMVRVMI